ncbi:hypothetical protein SAMN04487766_101129 [Actinomyces ruminicola]|uniref:Uncharacterized protein n=2 Tax=Actinomyces ruminicola TaxID=332524 RepID=A0A1G9RSK1_9ACTO|nr:hypothetical protein SAMN04487766_101129 [Actinomyces ruminicola]
MDSGASTPEARSSSSHRFSSAAASSSSAALLLPGCGVAPGQLDGSVHGDDGPDAGAVVLRHGEEGGLGEWLC